MKLTELNPLWINYGRTNREGTGIIFNCPKCQLEKRIHRVAVYFENPLDGGLKLEHVKIHWNREGNTFVELTLTPSINMILDECKWHGFITNGKIITV